MLNKKTICSFTYYKIIVLNYYYYSYLVQSIKDIFNVILVILNLKISMYYLCTVIMDALIYVISKITKKNNNCLCYIFIIDYYYTVRSNVHSFFHNYCRDSILTHFKNSFSGMLPMSRS